VNKARRSSLAAVWAPLACVLLLIPVALDFWYVHAFGVNVPYEDSWNGTLPIVKAMATGHITLALLWVPHNENRILFPNLLVGLMDVNTRANAKIDMYGTAIIMAASLGFLVTVARRTAQLPLILLVPLAYLAFDWVQVENILWAFQLAWMLIVFCLYLALWAFERVDRPAWFIGACLVGIVSSFSSLQGLLIWPVGLAYAQLAGWRRSWLIAWSGTAAAAVAVYFWKFRGEGASQGYQFDLHHPIQTLGFMVGLIGGFAPTRHHLAVGLAICALSVLLAYLAYSHSIPFARLRLAVALWTTGIFFEVLVTLGRAQGGLEATSRYTTYSLLIVIALYLVAVVLILPGENRGVTAASRVRRLPSVAQLISAFVVVATVGTLVISIPRGVQSGEAYYSFRSQGAQLLRDYRSASDVQLGAYLYAPSGAYVKGWAVWLQNRQWSVFSPRSHA
jgi:hypothetical protein